MSRKVLLLFLAASFALGACSTGSIKVSTLPEKADVLIGYDGGQETKIGETPLQIDGDFLSNKKGSYLTVVVKKNGFETQSMVVPTSYLAADLNITTKLVENQLSRQCEDASASIQQISKGTATVQYLVKQNRLMEALQQIDNLISEFPGVSVLYDLKGNILYLNKDLVGALNAYERSLELDPTNTDTVRMKNKIRGIVGERVPSSQGG